MFSRPSQPLKICLSTLLAALLIGMQNIDEYTQQLGSRYPELIKLSEDLRSVCRYTGLPQWFDRQKEVYSQEDAASEVHEPFAYDKSDIGSPQEADTRPSDTSAQPAPAPQIKKENQSPDIRKSAGKKKNKKNRKANNKKKKKKVKKKKKSATQKNSVQSAQLSTNEKASTPDAKTSARAKKRPKIKKKIKLVKKKKPQRKLVKRRIRKSYPIKLTIKKRKKAKLNRRKVSINPDFLAFSRSVLHPEPPQQPQPETALSADGIREANEKQPVHYRIMLMGDSMMQSLAPQTYNSFINRKGLHFICSARFSTGLSDPNYFDWPKSMLRTMEQKRPNLVVIFIGANDGVPIAEGKKVLYPGTSAAWKTAYAEKIKQVMDIAGQFGCQVIWIGLPPMGPRYRSMQFVIDTQREYCRENGITFLDTNPFMGNSEGKFIAYTTNASGKTVRIRMKDQCHLTDEGNHLLLEHLRPIIEQHIYHFRQNNPDCCLSQGELNSIKKASREVSINPMRSSNKKK